MRTNISIEVVKMVGVKLSKDRQAISKVINKQKMKQSNINKVMQGG